MLIRRMTLLSAALLLACIVPKVNGQNQAFTYQGRLTADAAGNPAPGPVNLIVRLFAAATGGEPIGTQAFDDVPLINGTFTIALNNGGEFTANPFAAGSDRWVEISVDGVTLQPRQKLSVAPLAAFSAAPWALSGQNLSYTAGNVGIGTNNPDRPLTLNQSSANVAGLRTSQLMSLRMDDETRWHINMIAPGPFVNSVGLNFAETGRSDYRLFLAPGGNVGIGTSLPSGRLEIAGGSDALIIRPPQMEVGEESRITFTDPNNATPSTALVFKKTGYPNLSIFSNLGSARLGVNTRDPARTLDVRGEIAFGPAGQFTPVASVAPLRTLRAVVNGTNGGLFSGQGIGVTRTGLGRYTLNFLDEFAGIPAITVTANSPVPIICTVNLVTTGSAQVSTFNQLGVAVDANFSIIAVGER